jgi:hypothetical protein
MLNVLIFAASVAAQANMNKNQMRDEMISVGDYRLHLKCMGSGSPTVILEAGLASPSTGFHNSFDPRYEIYKRPLAWQQVGLY